MELGGKLLDSLRIETQFLERLQSVGVVDGAAHTQKDDVENNRGSSEGKGLCAVPLQRSAGFEVWCQYLISTRWMSCRVLLRSLGRCCLGLVAVLVAGGAISLPRLPPATSKNPRTPYIISLLFLCFCSAGSNQHKIRAAGDKSAFIWEAGWEEPFGNNSTLSCFRNLEILPIIIGLCFMLLCAFFACLASCYLRASYCMLLIACFKLHASCSVFGARALLCLSLLIEGCFLCPLFSLLLRCSCFLGARGFMRLSQITLTDRFVHTDTRGLNKRVLLNMLSSVSILLSAFLRSAFH